jgi:hypothetical protein
VHLVGLYSVLLLMMHGTMNVKMLIHTKMQKKNIYIYIYQCHKVQEEADTNMACITSSLILASV